jgi:hypothetical protein
MAMTFWDYVEPKSISADQGPAALNVVCQVFSQGILSILLINFPSFSD